MMAGRRGLVDRSLDSGDRDCGFEPRPRRSGFLLAFFFFFLFLTMVLFSRQSVPCGPSNEVHLCRGINSWPWKKRYRDQLITARGNLYEKILAAPSVGRKHGYKCDVKGQSKKKKVRTRNCLAHKLSLFLKLTQ